MENGGYWAFYAFREDAWDGMDYELGDKRLPWSYWESVEKGEMPILDRKGTHLQFSVLKKALIRHPKKKLEKVRLTKVFIGIFYSKHCCKICFTSSCVKCA
jgi:hypothetical protein